MTPDNLDTLSDAEMSEVFAVEVAGWSKTIVFGNEIRFHNAEGDPADAVGGVPDFSTDANAVLPWLEKAGIWESAFVSERGGYAVSVSRGPDAEAVTFARAAAIALIRAKRSAQSR